MKMYEDLKLYIDGEFTPGDSGVGEDVLNPSNDEVLAHVPHAKEAELDKAVAAAEKGFAVWRKTSAFERSNILRKAADLMRTRADDIARAMTLEQGKVNLEAKLEVMMSADVIDWFAEEGRRAYGRIIPARADGVRQMVIPEPVGIVAGFSPWNFPVSQAIRKIGGALAAGCSIVVKCPEETPGSPVATVRCFHDAGVPPGVLNLVYGVPAEMSEYLIPHPSVRKISFTGSVPVGKHLAAMAGAHMKRITMELGG
ncbi:MAG: aldehyde dehydrogenase family protein, partial [Hyphomicrobiaceae bacterium]